MLEALMMINQIKIRLDFVTNILNKVKQLTGSANSTTFIKNLIRRLTYSCFFGRERTMFKVKKTVMR